MIVKVFMKLHGPGRVDTLEVDFSQGQLIFVRVPVDLV